MPLGPERIAVTLQPADQSRGTSLPEGEGPVWLWKVRYRGLMKNTQRLALLFGLGNLLTAEVQLAGCRYSRTVGAVRHQDRPRPKEAGRRTYDSSNAGERSQPAGRFLLTQRPVSQPSAPRSNMQASAGLFRAFLNQTILELVQNVLKSLLIPPRSHAPVCRVTSRVSSESPGPETSRIRS